MDTETVELSIDDVRKMPGYESISDEEAIRVVNSLRKLCALIYFLEDNKQCGRGHTANRSTPTVKNGGTPTLESVHFKQ